jgi:putative ABC transport system ATP-binding protein
MLASLINQHVVRLVELNVGYIEMKHSFKSYKMGDSLIEANKDITFSVEKGELAIILGSSGAGKSTVLNILGGMDTNDKGDVIIDGRNIAGASAHELTKYRRLDVGFVFQFYNLVPNLTAKENVELASEIVPDAMDPLEVLDLVGLSKRTNNFPAQLSGGEQQRVAIARAVAKNPKILLCDEPTGALDYNTGKQILQILQDMSRKHGATVVIVTHNSAIAPIADRVIHMHDGGVTNIDESASPEAIADIEW